MRIGTNAEGFIFRDDYGKLLARMPFRTMELVVEQGTSQEQEREVRFYAAEYVPGELFKPFKPGSEEIVLGPPKEFVYEVTLHACGNPDHQQYADIGPKKTVRVCTIGDACKVTVDYQERYDMGFGNCGKSHGTVWQLRPNRRTRRRVGRVTYSGGYRPLAEGKESTL
jgi:hypothetical protein